MSEKMVGEICDQSQSERDPFERRGPKAIGHGRRLHLLRFAEKMAAEIPAKHHSA